MKLKSILLTAVATLGLTTATMAQVPNYVPTNGLVGWWPFNGNANDESGNGNNGIVFGANLTSDRFGNTNKTYNFDGLNDRIKIPFNSALGNDTGTVSLWINSSQIPNSNDQDNLFGKGWGYPQLIYSNDAKAYISIANSTSSFSVIGTQQNISTNQWRHIMATYEGSSLKIYIDGILSNSSNVSPSPTYFSYCNSEYWIGGFRHLNSCIPNDSVQFFNGKIDDIGIWNRALTQQEITDLYNSCQLSVNTQPTNQTININNNAQFVVSSSDPNATYQWQTDLGVGFQNLNSVGQYSGTANDTLTIANTTLSNNSQPFRCIISSGSCSDTSAVAVLTVNNNVGINEASQDNLFSVYPNPAQSVINVKADIKLIGKVYSVYDNTGKVVLTGKLNSENTTIELGNLSGGIYMFNVGGNLKQTFKVIKE